MVIIGKIEDAFGVDGKLKVKLFAPQRLWESLEEIYLKKRGGDFVPFKVERSEIRGRKAYLKLEGVDSEEEALRLSGAHIFYPEEKLPKLKSGEYYYYQLVGSKVVGKNGKEFGTVQYVHDGGMYPILVLEDDKLIPFTKNFVVKVDTKNGTIVVDDEKIPEE